METQRLQRVVYELPGLSRKAQQFFVALARMLEEVEGFASGGGQVVIVQRDPAGLLPETVFRVANRLYPAVLFEMDQPFVLWAGNLVLRASAVAVECPTVAERDGPLVEDALGSYVQLPVGSEDFTALLPLGTVCERLKGHILWLDHTGVNLPARAVGRANWHELIGTLAAASNMYRYPTGEEWPFIIPATAGEFAMDITDPQPVRRSKFELVYDATLCNPLIQIDIATDLTRATIEALFPEPYGVGLAGLDQYFRSVYVDHPWPGLAFRFDLGYRSDQPGDMAGWLIHEGGRIGSG
jgi:hypothetical protein